MIITADMVSKRDLPHYLQKSIRVFILKETPIDIEHRIIPVAYVEPNGWVLAFDGDWFQALPEFIWDPPPRRTGELHLRSIAKLHSRWKNGTIVICFKVPYPFKRIADVLLFPSQLFIVSKVLPAAATTFTSIRARRRASVE
jgi:hypothetical protein